MLSGKLTHVLYIWHDGLIAVSSSGRQITASRRFSLAQPLAGDVARPEPGFDDWVQAHRRDLFQIVVDSVDELHVVEDIPKVSLRDRDALIGKRMLQRFRDARFTAYRLLAANRRANQPPDGAPEARVAKGTRQVFMTALVNDSTLNPWYEVLRRHRVRIRRLSSPALLSQDLVQLFARDQSGLLVSLNPAGLRQTLVIDGVIRFSRLASIRDSGAQAVRDEMLRTLQYLSMSQRIPRAVAQAGTLKGWIVDAGIEGTDSLGAELVVDPAFKVPLMRVPTQALAPTPVADWPGLGVWVTALRSTNGFADYTNAQVRQFDQLQIWKNRIWAGAGAVAATGLAIMIGVSLLLQAHRVESQTYAKLHESYYVQISELERQLQLLPVSAGEMRAVVESAAQMRARQISAANVLGLIGQAMPQDPAMQLRSVEWRRSDDQANESQLAGNAPDVTAPDTEGQVPMAAPMGVPPARASPCASWVRSPARWARPRPMTGWPDSPSG
ncbi:MAG: hypothetical protein R3E68_03085 [Burkholderiaceae bacterium]